MALDTYANLKTAITDHLDRSDLSSHVDDFIDLAEARHKREIRIREMLNRDALTVDDRYVSLPTGYLEAKMIRLLTNPVTVLDHVNLYEMTRRRRTGTGKPGLFTIHAQIEFDRDADQSYSGEIIYYKEETALSNSNTSNNILTRAADCYLYAALAASAPFLMNDERVPLWETLYRNARDELNALDRRGSHVGPIRSRIGGAVV